MNLKTLVKNKILTNFYYLSLQMCPPRLLYYFILKLSFICRSVCGIRISNYEIVIQDGKHDGSGHTPSHPTPKSALIPPPSIPRISTFWGGGGG
jgi:hypothetical protein